MGPRAAGLSRSMGGAVWSPWPWPLSAQARTLLDPHPHPSSHSGDSADASASNRPAPLSRLPFPEATSSGKGKAAWGLVYNHYLASGGTYILTHVCVCVCELHPHYRHPSITWGSRRDDFSLPLARIGNPILGR